ncbi:MAG: phosphoribosyltransferase [Verrucomicrobia bacterium]|nr:phosphoribosyltransferase [Verrucomicrobiota bacterium]MBS0647462.1 phosphoribosyltransferase [Verrucomicrobiota bacterium]
MKFKDRCDAGIQLASHLKQYEQDPEAIVIALPRGGVVIGDILAQKLRLPLDVICPKKVTSIYQPEYALGAVTEKGHFILNPKALQQLKLKKEDLIPQIDRQQKEAARRLQLYRQNRPARQLKGKRVLLVDDGIATGLTMEAAIKTAREEQAAQIILVVPVAPPSSLRHLASQVDATICLIQDPDFMAVGCYYESFSQVSDDEVIALMHHRNS